jgi:hypothetical protein
MVTGLVLGCGLGLLIVLAVLIGQQRAQEAAWRAIAAERRELDAWERELIAAAEARGCPGCRLRDDGEES